MCKDNLFSYKMPSFLAVVNKQYRMTPPTATAIKTPELNRPASPESNGLSLIVLVLKRLNRVFLPDVFTIVQISQTITINMHPPPSNTHKVSRLTFPVQVMSTNEKMPRQNNKNTAMIIPITQYVIFSFSIFIIRSLSDILSI